MKSMPWLVAVVAVVAVAAVAALAGCSNGSSSGDRGSGAGAGQAVFQKLCAACHGSDGRPPEAMVARLGVRDLTAPAFRARVTPALIEQQVRTGSKNKLMPAFAGAIDDAEITAVAAYVASPQFVAPP